MTLPEDSSELYEIRDKKISPTYIKVLHTDQFRQYFAESSCFKHFSFELKNLNLHDITEVFKL